MGSSRVLKLAVLICCCVLLVVCTGLNTVGARDKAPAPVLDVRAPEVGSEEMKKNELHPAACRNCSKACCRSRVACNKKQCRCGGKKEKVE